MLTNAMGLILADHKRVHLGELTRLRALAAVPFGGRYRMIDFILSNMVNDGITYVGVVTMTKYKSLLDHIGTGASWDLDRMSHGLLILPPYINSSYFDKESGDLTGLYEFVIRGKEKYVLISDANGIFNDGLDDLFRFHEEKGADMTVVYNHDGRRFGSPSYALGLNKDQILQDMLLDAPDCDNLCSALGMIVISRELLLHILSQAIARGSNDFSIEWLLRQHPQYKIQGFHYEGLCLRVNSLAAYYQATMRLLEPKVRQSLFHQPGRPIFTKVKNEAPAIYESGNYVSNSLISDGCRILGSVSDSVLFRGVDVGPHANLQDCIIFQDAVIGEGADLRHVILDKNTVVRPGVRLQGQAEHPMVIGKGAEV